MPKTKSERAKSVREWRAKMKQAGLCNRCGKTPPRDGGRTCQSCYEKQHATYLEQVSSGRQTQLFRRTHSLCMDCGKPIADGDTYNGKPSRTCRECRAINRRAHTERRLARYQGVLERDGFSCRVCGRDRRLHIHHIDGDGMSKNGVLQPYISRNNRADNMITLCQHCHYSITCLRRASQSGRKLAVALLLA